MHANHAAFPLPRIFADVGIDNAYLLNQYAFDSLLEKRTWETPAIQPTGQPLPASVDADGLVYEKDGLRLSLLQEQLSGSPSLDGVPAYSALLENIGSETHMVNGLAFTIALGEQADIEFPLNTPHGIIHVDSLKEGELLQGGLVSTSICVAKPEGRMNLLFLDPIEKWSLGVYKRAGKLFAVFIAALECNLAPGESVRCGTLYIQFPQGDPYTAIRDFFSALGYHPAEGGWQGGVMYSCHPNGTMDGTMDSEPNGPGLVKYAEYLDTLHDMGIDHVWLLPIFEHTGRGVYHCSDQDIIDPRYGGEEAVRFFVDKAHSLGMTVLFDYVPHGPAKGDPLDLAHPEWRAMRRDGTPQEEWNCVSFDMTLPTYRQYTTDLIRGHVRRFGIDGARIDCAMGGLSNWQPQAGSRPSASNLSGGVDITHAIFDGFRSFPKKTLVLPENFNPVPAYWPYTDVFYGMNLYRVLVELDQRYRDNPAAYAQELMHWLDVEHRVMPEGIGRLRFLGNHDTVSWVWQASRAVDWYGLERAKALFAIMMLIDGMPMLYMGDEDPALAHKQGPVLRDFFKQLIALRKSTVGDSTDITYLPNDCGVFACRRVNNSKTYLVAVNLNDKEVSLLLDGRQVTLDSYAWTVLEE